MKKISQQKKITFLMSFLFILIFAFIGVKLLNNSHATQAIYNGKLIGMNSSLGDPNDITSLNQLGVNSERGEIDMSGSSFGNPNYDGTTANWVDQLTTAHIVPLPIMNQYIEMSTMNQTQFANALVSWCQQYCAGGTFYNNNTSANAAYAPQTLEILNEPYGDWWGYPVTSADVSAYASLLKQIRTSLNSAGFSSIGILAAANDNWTGTINWDSTLATDGGFNYVQGVTVHAYGDHGSGSQYDPNGNIVIPTGSVGSDTDGWQQVYYVHQLLDNDGLTAQANSIYITEDGWCTSTTNLCNSADVVSEPVKDSNIKIALTQVATVPWIKGFWYFNLHPYQECNNGTCVYNSFALYDPSNNETPAWSAFQSAATSLEAEYPSEFSVTVNNPTPTVSITTPINNATVSGSTSITASASESGGTIASVQYKLDGNNLGSAVTASPYTYNWDTTQVANGSHTLTAVVTDANGNTATSSAVSVSVSNGSGGGGTPVSVQNLAFNSSTDTLSWTAYPGASSYVIAQVHNPTTTRNTDYSWPHVTSTSCVVPSSCNLTVTPNQGEVLDYGILPLDANGNTVSGATWAPEITVTWPVTKDTTPPTQPTNLTASAVSSSQINLSWTASTDNVAVTGYNIYRSVTGSNPSLINTVTTTSYGDSGLISNTKYTYYVVAEDGAGNKSTPSSSVSATTLTAPTLATVEGVISSSSTNTPLANALVFTGDLATTHGSVSSTTNSSGQYLLSGIKPTSQHNYYYSASGYLKQSIYVGYPAGINIKNVTLNP